MAKLATVNALRRERQRTGRDQDGRIGIGQVSWLDCGGKQLHNYLQPPGGPPTPFNRVPRLAQGWLRKPAVVPRVRQPPWHDVLTCPAWRIVDPDGNDVDVIGDNGVGHMKGEWG